MAFFLTSNRISEAGYPCATNIVASNSKAVNDANLVRHIRFRTPAEADARRQRLSKWLWADGLPTTMPSVSNVTFNVFSEGGDLKGIEPSVVAKVDRLDANVMNTDFHTFSYLLSPKNDVDNHRVVILHQGHQGGMRDGICEVATGLLRRGFTVIAMQMPNTGWNNDTTIEVPKHGTITLTGTYSDEFHNSLFDQLGPIFSDDGTLYRFFLEPVVQNINYAVQALHPVTVSTIGLSGGGWTTTLVAAVDLRIQFNCPVAASNPMYIANYFSDMRTLDAETTYEKLFDENIRADGSGGGVATTLEVYALAAYGEGRHNIMITNKKDPQVFWGMWVVEGVDLNKDGTLDVGGFVCDRNSQTGMYTGGLVADVVKNQLARGKWEYYLDETNTTHSISMATFHTVIVPAALAVAPNH